MGRLYSRGSSSSVVQPNCWATRRDHPSVRLNFSCVGCLVAMPSHNSTYLTDDWLVQKKTNRTSSTPLVLCATRCCCCYSSRVQHRAWINSQPQCSIRLFNEKKDDDCWLQVSNAVTVIISPGTTQRKKNFLETLVNNKLLHPFSVAALVSFWIIFFFI